MFGPSRSQAARRRHARPALEALDRRELLSTIPAFSTHKIDSRPPHVATINQLATVTPKEVSTVPGNGDVNPYGVAFVPANVRRGGLLNPGDLLVANFNNVKNLQGTGTTIVRITPGGQQSVFFQSSTPGLDTGLAVLKSGFVIVGSVPSVDGTPATVGQGKLLVIDSHGHQVASFSSRALLNGPWDLTVDDRGEFADVYVSNVLSGTVSRLTLKLPDSGREHVQLLAATQIASGYLHHGDPNAFEVGPSGLAYDDKTDTLYVVSEGDDSVYAIAHASSTRDKGAGRLVYRDNVHLHGPVGLTFAPDGNLITANGDGLNVDPNQPSELVEFTTRGQFVGQFSIDPTNGGAFGVAVTTTPGDLRLAAVDDVTATVKIYTLHK